MLDPWIIEEIKRREQRNEQPVLELPLHGPPGRHEHPATSPDHREKPENQEDPPRGVTIIDYGIACW